MNRMRSAIAYLTCFALSLIFSGCGGGNGSSSVMSTLTGQITNPGLAKNLPKSMAYKMAMSTTPGALYVLAISSEGKVSTVEVQTDGSFSLPVETGDTYQIAFVRDSDGDGIAETLVGVVQIPENGGVTNFIGTVPGTIDLGEITLQAGSADMQIQLLPDIQAALQASLDTDDDGTPDYTDNDDDGDGVSDLEEENSLDADDDGIPQLIDSDKDGNGIVDVAEMSSDLDQDGIPNGSDLDDDNDGIPDFTDTDDDNDGIADEIDDDDNGDGLSDSSESTLSSDRDLDGDGLPNELDADDDGDGINDVADTDDDGDGIPDVSDTDDDNDGISDDEDTVSVDTSVDLDQDGVDDTEDTDDDNDGIPDSEDVERDSRANLSVNILIVKEE